MARGSGHFDGTELRRLRRAAGHSQQHLADLVKTTRSQIIAYEQGRAKPEPARLAALAAAVGCRPTALTGTADLAALRRAAGLTRTAAVTRLADLAGERVPMSKWMLQQAETGRVPAAWQDTALRRAVVTALATAYGVTAAVAAQALTGSPAPAARPEPRKAPDPPDPGPATTLDELVATLRLLRSWAGNPSYAGLTDRVNTTWTRAGRPAGEQVGKTTVVDAFRPGRRRLNADLVTTLVQVMCPDSGYVARWDLALRAISQRESAAGLVRVQDTLPPILPGFTGRGAELERLLTPGAVAVIEGMAGVGKTSLAVHAAHLLERSQTYDRVFFVNLRGFHPDPAQPPADPAAVLDGFLRLLGVPGQRIPPDLAGRSAAYRASGVRLLVVLDNAADSDQIRPLLPVAPGSTVLVTSRRQLTGLPAGARLTLGVFTPQEARRLLIEAAPGKPATADPGAADSIAGRCGHLPLALALVAAHMRARPGWTIADHADWLDERHTSGLLDTGVEAALDLSYQNLPTGPRRLLRLAALHPGQDLDVHAAAALSGAGLPATRAALDRLLADHLMQRDAGDRYTYHDLIRAYATARARDEDRPADRRAALTRLFDHYLAAAAAATGVLDPAVSGPLPAMADEKAALAWLETERATLLAVAAHTAGHGWPGHTIRLARILFNHLIGAHAADAVIINGHACQAADRHGDHRGHAQALADLADAEQRLGRYAEAATHLRQSLQLFVEIGNAAGESTVLSSLGALAERTGDYPAAERYGRQALQLARRLGAPRGEARACGHLGDLLRLLGRHDDARAQYHRALSLSRQIGNRIGEAAALGALGHVDAATGDADRAVAHLTTSRDLFQELGVSVGVADAWDGLGTVQTGLGRPDVAAEYHQRALDMFRECEDRQLEAWALNGLGEAARAAGRPHDAIAHHTAAEAVAAEIGIRHQRGRAHDGLGHAHADLGDAERAAGHWERALELYAGLPQAEEIRRRLA